MAVKDAACVLEETEMGTFALRGELNFSTVMALSRSSVGQLWLTDTVTLDLAAVTRTDSAGLALLVEWIRMARRQDKTIRFRHIPAQMMAVAELVGLDGLLPVAPQ